MTYATQTHDPAIAGRRLYSKGDLAEFTGKTEMLYGALAFEFRWLEGHRKGETGWTYKGPQDRP